MISFIYRTFNKSNMIKDSVSNYIFIIIFPLEFQAFKSKNSYYHNLYYMYVHILI